MDADELIDKLEHHSDGFQSYYGCYATIKEIMIEFAKLHVQKALEICLIEINQKEYGYNYEHQEIVDDIKLSINSVLENIK